ncbi:MAG: CoB--CoM heterodisulfide reductase iron-sulfur subunit B family protein [Solirubrobacterales bacterium]
MRIAYYPGCSLDGTANEYGHSTERVAKLLGIDLWEIPDWSCCGASSAHQTDHLLAVALPARNLAIAEQEGLDVLAPCAACYNRFRGTEYEVRNDPNMKQLVQQTIDMSYEAKVSTVSVTELLADRYGLDNLRKKVIKPLHGMQPACYYGCLLVRPTRITGFDDPENPMSMDHIMEALGASPVDWAGKSECCSAGIAQTKPDIGLEMIFRLLVNAKENGADSFVTACPICMLNLDMRQKAIEKKYKVKFNLPVYYVTELVAIACGDTPEEAGVKRHFTEAVSLFNELPSKALKLAEEMAAKEAAKKPAKVAGDSEEKPAAKPKSAKETKAAPDPEAPQPDCGGKDNIQLMLAVEIYDADEEKAMALAELLNGDEAKMNKLKEILAQDKAKALKVADALLAKGQKKPAGEEAKA